MGLRPKILGYNMFNRKHINDMDNELEKRLHNIEKSTDTNNNKKYTHKIFNKMLFIKNYLNNKFLRKFLQQHHYHYTYNTNINYHKIISQILLMTFLILMLRITTINCLPVTSKPIENTPEHLAWEAWIMLPPPANSERHRKIMPKSIFVLPTNINNNNKNSHNLPIPQPQIQCPPGYRVDNSKCIPTISINRDQLLIDQLTNLLPVSMKPDDSSYDDYDYDYTNGDTINYDLDMLQSYNKQQSPPLINSNPNTFRVSEKDSEPLKINFSLDKFSITKDDNQNNKKKLNPLDIKNDSNEFIMDLNNDNNSNENIKLRPFRDQEASASIIELSTATNDGTNKETQSDSTSAEIDTSETEIETKDENDNESILQQQYSTIFGRKESTTTSTISVGNTETVSESNDSSTNSDTTEFNKSHQTESKRESTTSSVTIDNTTTNVTEDKSPINPTSTSNIDNKNNNSPEISLDTLELPNFNKNADIFITTLSSIDSSTMVSILSSDENEMSSITQNYTDYNSTTTSDYEYDQMTTLNKNNDNLQQNQNVEVITEQMEKEKNLVEKLSEESLVLDKSIEENMSTDLSSEISLNQDEMTTNPPVYDDLLSEFVDPSSSPSTMYNNIEKSSTESSASISSTTEKIKKLNKTTEKNLNVEKLEHKIVHVDRHRLHHKYHGIPQSTVSISASQPIEWHEDREPLMESIESNNRFVYHHLGSSPIPQSNSDSHSTKYISSATENKKSNFDINVMSSSTPIIAQPKRDTQADINEQLRIINMIVEENKRRAEAAKIRFPENSPTSTQNPLRSQTLVRFPTESNQESTPYHIATSYYQPQNGRFDPEKLIFHRRFFQHQQQQQQQHATTQIPSDTTSIITTTTTVTPDTQKPFWWLPSGWEIDQNGDRPMLIRFWSRSPSRNSEQFTSNTEPYIDQFRTAASNTHHIVTDNLQTNENYNNNQNTNYNINTSDGLYSQQSSAATTTTSRYRANSRSPTDNLYHEVPSSQNVYKVLNAARQWKNSKR